MSRVALDDLVKEAKSASRIGPAWIRVVELAVRSKTKNRPPHDYGFQEWNQESIEDVVQEVFERRILKKGGLEYVLAEATTTEHAHAAIHRLVGLALSDMREPNVLNNIFENLDRRFNEIGIDLSAVRTVGVPNDYVLNEESAERSVSRILLSQPRYPNRGTHRESAIFGPDAFEEIVRRLQSEVVPLNARVVRGGLKLALTHLVRAEYYIDDVHDFIEGADGGQSIENEATNDTREFALKAIGKISERSEKVFVALSYGVKSDSELAKALGLKSRQTAAGWHESMKAEIFSAFESLEIPVEEQPDIVIAMRDVLGVNVGKFNQEGE